MSSITTRAGKGAALTNAEVDANFTNLNTDKAEKSITISAGAGLTGGGDLSGNRTLALDNSGVSAGAYGGNNSIPSLTIDAYGRVTAAGTVTPSGTWGISISGTAANASAVPFSGVSGKPTTLSGYGITDAQATLISGTNIKTINGSSVLGSGNIQIDGGVTSFNTRTGAVTLSSGDVTTALGYTPYNSTNPSGYLTDAMRSRGTIAEASVDSATLDGHYNLTTAVDSASLLTFNPGGSTGPTQLRFRYTGSFEFRNKTDSSSWTGWKTVLHSSNYNSYAPTLTGGGASGTWGISITGNAATITSQANSATITASTTAGSANTIVRRDGNGYIFNNYFNSTDNSVASGVTAVMVKQGDSYLRSGTAAAIATFISGQAMNISGNASTATNSQGVTFTTQPNASWGGQIQLGGNGGGSGAALIAKLQSSDGNLHMDNGSGKAMYLGYYHPGTIYLNGGTYNISNNGANYNGTSANTNSISSATGGSYTWTNTNYWRTNNGGYSGSLSSAPLQVYSDSNNSAYFSFHKGGHFATNMGLDADNVIRIGGWSAAANRWELDMSGNNWVAGSSRAPIFYDLNDTAYYCDPNSRSRFVALKLNTNNWITDSLDFNRIYFTQGDGTMIRGYTGTWYIQMGSSSTTTSIIEGNGNFYTTGAVTAYWSDKRLKKNIKRIDDWREILRKSNGYRFEWNDLGLKMMGESAEEEKGVKVGILAQDAKEALPQAAVIQLMQYEKKENGVLIPKEGINYDPEDPYLTVHMEKYIPVLIEASKGLMEENDELKSTVAELLVRISALENQGN